MAYDNTQRSVAAAETRARIHASARTLFIERGFAGTTIREVAEAAGVSQETIYKTFGSKAVLLKAVYDVSLAGDDQAIPLAERPEARAAWEAESPALAARAYAELAMLIAERTDSLLRVLLRSRATDRTLNDFAHTTDQERLAGSRMHVEHWHAAGWVRPDLTLDRASEILWALNSPEPRWLLLDAGWSTHELASWLAETVELALFVRP